MFFMTIKAIWANFSFAFNQEIQIAIRSPILHWLSWIFPLLLFILVSANFSEGTLLNLPVSVVDHDHSLLSNKLIRNLNAAPHADIKAIDGTINTSLLRLGSAKDYALLYIPSHFERDVLTGRQPTVRMYYNALFYASGSYAIQDFSGVIAQLNVQFRPILASSMGRSIPPLARVTLSYDSLFNPSGNYIYYQQFAATIHMLQLFVITCTIYIMSRGTALLTNKTFTSALLGKLAPYTLFFTTLLLIEIAALSFFFDAKITGNPFYLLLVGFFYVIAAQSVGMLLFVFTKSIFTAYSLIGMLVSLALAFSGFAMPIMAMAWPAQIVANIQPLTHALNVMFDIFLREVSLLRVTQVCLILLIYPAICAFLIRNRLLTRLRMQEAF